MERIDVAVIGGGITGLACAHALGDGVAWRLYEGGSETGGVIRTAERDGFLLESGPDAFLNEKPETLDLIRRLGLESEVIQVSSQSPQRSFVWHGGRLRPVPEGTWLIAPTRFIPFFKSDLCSIPGKIRAGFEIFIPPRVDREDESVASFIRRRFGKEMLKRIGEPMVAGIYGGDAEVLSAHTVLGRFCELERRYGGVIEGLKEEIEGHRNGVAGPRYALFLSLRRGMGSLTARLAQTLGDRVQTGAHVERLSRDLPSGRWILKFRGGRPDVEAESVCLALAAPAAARLLAETEPDLAALLARVQYESTMTVNLAFDRAAIAHPLDGFGFVVPRASGLRVIGCSFSSVKFAGRAPEGNVLLRAFVGRMSSESDEAVVPELLTELKPVLGLRAAPLFTQVNRHPQAMPQYRVGHAELVRQIRAAAATVQGLALAGNAFGGVGLSDCIREGASAARRLTTPITEGIPI